MVRTLRVVPSISEVGATGGGLSVKGSSGAVDNGKLEGEGNCADGSR